MLYFNSIENGRLITKLSMDEIRWLTKFKIIKEGSTGFLKEDSPEVLPFFEDYELTYSHAVSMHNYSKEVITQMQSYKGFNSESVRKFCMIMDTIIKTKQSIKVTCS